MEQLQDALDFFEFKSLEDISIEQLKQSFKSHILKAHPDKGGNSDSFDKVYTAYACLFENLKKISDNYLVLKTINNLEELTQMRPDEIINRIFDEYDNKKFNDEFEMHQTKILNQREASDWLNAPSSNDDLLCHNLTEGKYGSATQVEPIFSEDKLNEVFEENIRKKQTRDKLASASASASASVSISVSASASVSNILYPDEMAYNGSISDIINYGSSYNSMSMIFSNPEYSDLYTAYNIYNTILDKVTPFNDDEYNKNLDDVIKERNNIILPLNKEELEDIQAKIATRLNEYAKYTNGGNHLEITNEYSDLLPLPVSIQE